MAGLGRLTCGSRYCRARVDARGLFVRHGHVDASCSARAGAVPVGRSKVKGLGRISTGMAENQPDQMPLNRRNDLHNPSPLQVSINHLNRHRPLPSRELESTLHTAQVRSGDVDVSVRAPGSDPDHGRDHGPGRDNHLPARCLLCERYYAVSSGFVDTPTADLTTSGPS
jgi:hypothetical protein